MKSIHTWTLCLLYSLCVLYTLFKISPLAYITWYLVIIFPNSRNKIDHFWYQFIWKSDPHPLVQMQGSLKVNYVKIWSVQTLLISLVYPLGSHTCVYLVIVGHNWWSWNIAQMHFSILYEVIPGHNQLELKYEIVSSLSRFEHCSIGPRCRFTNKALHCKGVLQFVRHSFVLDAGAVLSPWSSLAF